MSRVLSYLRRFNAALGAGWNRFWFTPISPRTLGAIRIAAGLLAFYAVATYGPDLERFFASDGMLPMSLVGSLYRPAGQLLSQWSVLDYVPDSWLWPTYYVSLTLIGLFVLGVGGRLIAILATIVTISFFARAPLVIGEFEAILSFLLVYLCVGRSSDAFSIRSLIARVYSAASQPTAPSQAHDSLTSSGDRRSISGCLSPLNTIAVRLIQVHIVAVHLMMGFAQLSAPEAAWWSGEGMWLAAGRPGMALVDVSGLEDHPRAVAAWSHAVTVYLLVAPALLWHQLARPLMLAIGLGVWISVALATGWVPFAWAMVAGLMAFTAPSPRQ
ncbi:MAG: hypothetical protein IT424_12155 [Pirellulales bacterium]|nr:hypothetical protein [Pirellulales bacterium]